jgi:hypothetical protein
MVPLGEVCMLTLARLPPSHRLLRLMMSSNIIGHLDVDCTPLMHGPLSKAVALVALSLQGPVSLSAYWC